MKTTLFFTASLLIILASCNHSRQKIIKVDPAYARYVSGYTSGNISRRHHIRIELAEPFKNADIKKDPLGIPDSAVVEDIFDFEPSLKGKAVWLNNRIIEFIPSEPLPPNQLYTVTFDLERVAKVDKKYKEFVFQFASYPQHITTNFNGLEHYDAYNIEWQKFSGSLHTSDFADSLEVRKTLRAIVNGQSRNIKWVHTGSHTDFYFYIDSIRRTETQGELKLEWDGANVHSPDKGVYETAISALGDFKVTETKVLDEDDQVVELHFSDPIQYGQNLNGIITVSGIDKLTYSIGGNTVRVFLDERLEGRREISVSEGIKNFKGYHMNTPFRDSITFMEPQPKIKLFGNGSILPNSGGLIFPFEAISLKAVDVRVIKIYQNNIHQFLQVNNLDGKDELTRLGKVIREKTIDLTYDKSRNLKQWNTHVIDLGEMIRPDPGSIYRVSIRFKKDYAICNCEEEEQNVSTDRAAHSEVNHAEELEWNENGWYRYGSFDDGYESWNYYGGDGYTGCDESYYYGKAVSRNIIASDIGMIYKLDENKLSHAFVTDMITAQPLAGCTVEYFDYTRQVIAKGITDKEGMLDIQLKQKPFLMVASSGKQKGYLKLGDGYVNSLSKFDIEGEMVQKGIKGFLYGERGVWRPGDSIYMSFMLEDKEEHLPDNHPVKFELTDPNGDIVYQCTKTENHNGLYDFRTATGDDAVTGYYMAVARVGNKSFSQQVRIETVKPNRLKIYFDIQKDNISSRNGDTIGKLRVQWLHGAIARNLKAVVNVSLNQAETRFDGYKNFVFDSPVKKYYSESTTIFDGHLDANGQAAIKAVSPAGRIAPGMLRANFVTRVFEEGGDFSIDRISLPLSPYRHYVGIRTPETKRWALETGKQHTLEIASVTSGGKAVDLEKVQLRIYKLQWRWWYEQDDENLSDYVARSGALVIADSMLSTRNGRAVYKLRISDQEYGRYLVLVSDVNGGHQSGKIVTFDWPYWSRGNKKNSENSNMLNFSCDKTQYTTGETIQLSFPSPSSGKALVSVETGTKVVHKFWINTVQGETRYEFKATPEMSPNAYIHVTLLQPHASTKNDLPIRMYGVVPVMVDDPKTHLKPMLAMADAWKPESRVSIQVSEEEGKAMNYTLAVVDEGLLDLTHFRTPQPWNRFYAREALGVKTWDMYDAVIGAYAGKLDRLLSIGGDGSSSEGKGAKANRFKPMVKFIGPFTLGAGQKRTHSIEIPNYVGSVRVMLVAENNGAYGSTDKVAAVKKPLMVLATLPRVLGPSESVFLPVDVFAMEKHVKDVKVDIEVNEMLTVDGASQQKLHFDRVGDEVVNFKLNVAQRTGIARVKVVAVCGQEVSTQEIEIDVRMANPKVVDAEAYVVAPGKSISGKMLLRGVRGTNRMVIEASSIPSIGLEKRMDYLIQYPHGCIEQTTSSVFPQLFVGNLTELKKEQTDLISKHIKAGLKRLQSFQTSNGGFAYWPGEGEDSEWGSNYAGHFMIEAEKLGYTIPANMKSRWVKYQQDQAKNWVSNNSSYQHPHGEESYQLIQAYRLFVLSLCNQSELGAMNRMREEKNLSPAAKWRLAAAYQLAGQPEVAKKLIAGLSTKVAAYRELSYSYGSDSRDKAMILETLSLMGEREKSESVAKEVTEALNSEGWMSTQETAYNLLAMAEYAGVKDHANGMNFTCAVNDRQGVRHQSRKSICQVVFTEKDLVNNNIVKLSNNGSATLYVKVLVEGIPMTGDQSASSKNLSVAVRYVDMKGQEIQPDKLIQGTDFMAVVTVKNPSKKTVLKEMTLNQIFASGWEIHNNRMDEQNEVLNQARYQDIRDDRVYSYYDLGPEQSKTFTVKLNATYLGRYYLPTLYSEAMYDQSINARIPGKWVEVVKDQGVAVR